MNHLRLADCGLRNGAAIQRCAVSWKIVVAFRWPESPEWVDLSIMRPLPGRVGRGSNAPRTSHRRLSLLTLRRKAVLGNIAERP
jgi:hypothetical protein